VTPQREGAPPPGGWRGPLLRVHHP
jgi:hypothetical protein